MLIALKWHNMIMALIEPVICPYSIHIYACYQIRIQDFCLVYLGQLERGAWNVSVPL
jgi:hypothetical protein